MRKICNVCGNRFEAKRRDARTCSAACRSNRRRGAGRTDGQPDDKSLVAAAKRELEVAGKLGTMLGQQAIVLAARMSSGTQTTGGIAALSRELRTVMAAAIGAAPTQPPAAGTGDEVDELRERRNTKQCAG